MTVDIPHGLELGPVVGVRMVEGLPRYDVKVSISRVNGCLY